MFGFEKNTICDKHQQVFRRDKVNPKLLKTIFNSDVLGHSIAQIVFFGNDL